MNIEAMADIKNKLQPAKTALDLFSQGKDVPKEFIEQAKKDLDEMVGMLKEKGE